MDLLACPRRARPNRSSTRRLHRRINRELQRGIVISLKARVLEMQHALGTRVMVSRPDKMPCISCAAHHSGLLTAKVARLTIARPNASRHAVMPQNSAQHQRKIRHVAKALNSPCRAIVSGRGIPTCH